MLQEIYRSILLKARPREEFTMRESKLEPSRELLTEVMTIANTKKLLPAESGVYLNFWGVNCRANNISGGRLEYKVGGKLTTRLRFIVESDGSTVVQSYSAGDWEHAVEPTYEHAEFWNKHFKEEGEVNKLWANIGNVEDMIRTLEERVSQGQDIARTKLGDFYAAANRYKDAEREYIRAVELWPKVSPTHYYLGCFYSHALAHAEVLRLPPYLLSPLWADLTLDVLGYSLEQVVNLVEKHFEKALELAPQKETPERTILKGTLSGLRVFKKEFGSKELELMKAREMFDHNPEESVRTLEQIVVENPNFAAGWGELGTAYLQNGMPIEAKKALVKAIDLDPNNPVYHLGLSGLYQAAMGNEKGAMDRNMPEVLKQWADSGLKVPPEFLNLPELSESVYEITLEALGCTFEYALKIATKHARRALELAKDNELRRAAKSRLEEIGMLDQM